MPNLFGWFVSLVTGVFGWVVSYFGARAAFAGALVASYVIIAAAALACLNGFFSLLGMLPVFAAADPRAVSALGFFWMALKSCIPDNLTTVIAVCIGADACVFLWRYKAQIIGDLAAMK